MRSTRAISSRHNTAAGTERRTSSRDLGPDEHAPRDGHDFSIAVSVVPGRPVRPSRWIGDQLHRHEAGKARYRTEGGHARILSRSRILNTGDTGLMAAMIGIYADGVLVDVFESPAGNSVQCRSPAGPHTAGSIQDSDSRHVGCSASLGAPYPRRKGKAFLKTMGRAANNRSCEPDRPEPFRDSLSTPRLSPVPALL